MSPVEAMLLLSRAKKRTGVYMPVPYDHIKDSGLETFNLVRNRNDNAIITCQVKRLEYIKWLEQTHNLFPKRTELLSVLRDSLRKPLMATRMGGDYASLCV